MQARGDNNLLDFLLPILVFGFWAVVSLVRKLAEKNAQAQDEEKRKALPQKKYKPLDDRTIRYDRQGGKVRHTGPEPSYARTAGQRPSIKESIRRSVQTAAERLEQKVRQIEAMANQAAAQKQPTKAWSVSDTIKKKARIPQAPAVVVDRKASVLPPTADSGFEVRKRHTKHAAAHKAGTTDVLFRLLDSKRGLRAAFLLSEVLGKPVALRDDPFIS